MRYGNFTPTPAMRFFSTPQSALNLEITQLAIFECVLSAVLYITIGIRFGTMRYLAWAVVIAPLMLCRTAASIDWALGVYASVPSRCANWLIAKVSSLSPKWHTNFIIRIGAIFLIALIAALVGTTIRLIATLYWTIRRPLQTLKQVPQNWLRQSLCTDLHHPPEVVPLETIKGDELDIMTFPDLWQLIRQNHWPVLAGFPLLLAYIPSVIYRVSFKATTFAYAPFIWVAHTTVGSPLPVKTRLERILKGELEKVCRRFSWFVLSIVAGKIAADLGLIDLGWVARKFPSQYLVDHLLVPGSWPWWQLTLTMGAALTVALFLFADAAFARLDGVHAWSGQIVLKIVRVVTFVRGVRVSLFPAL